MGSKESLLVNDFQLVFADYMGVDDFQQGFADYIGS